MDINKLCPSCLQPTVGVNPCPTCGYDRYTLPKISQHLPLQSVLNGQYLIGRVLGEGGFGITYLGMDLNLMTKVAIKEYFPEGLAVRRGNKVFPAKDESKDIFDHGVTNFYNEARILAKFRADPHIVNVENFFCENGTAYFVMEYIDGRSLKQYLRDKGGTLPLAETVQILLPVMEALERVHAAGLLHRDVAPDNIYITKAGVSKLLDFGSARFETGEKTRSTAAIIKPGYAPPEQYSSRREQGPWTDVYAMGATYYRVLTGKLPPEAPDRLLDAPLPTPSELGILLPAKAEAVILTALAVKCSDRFQSMQSFREAMEEAAGEECAEPTAPTSVATKSADPVPPVWKAVDIDQDLPENEKPKHGFLRWFLPLILLAGLLGYLFAEGIPAAWLRNARYGNSVENVELEMSSTGSLYAPAESPGSNAYRADASWLNYSLADGGWWIINGLRSGLQPVSLQIPDMINNKPVSEIAKDAFRNSVTLESVQLPSVLTAIGENAFMGCTALSEIEIPEGVTKLDHRVFLGCTSLENITLPDSVVEISDYAFLNVPNLTVHCHAGSFAASWAEKTGRSCVIE